MFVSSGRHINKDLPWIYRICLISVRFSTRLFPQVTARKIWKVQRKPPGPRSGSVEKWPGKRIDRLSHDESYEGLKNTHPWLYGWDFWKKTSTTFACFSVLSLTRIICNLCIYIYMYARFRNVRGIVADLALPATAKVRKKSSCEFPQWPYVTIRRLRRGKLRPRDEASHISSMEAYGACSRVAATMTGKHCFKRQ